MKTLDYVLLDVFTTTPFGGNQLAVFLNGYDLSTKEMQLIAKELNNQRLFFFPHLHQSESIISYGSLRLVWSYHLQGIQR
jgi:PhzF family phenazine biosynthesis protein